MQDQIAKKLEVVEIEEEMKSSYIDYAMSVIVGRALPDVRDGLKPVHRRILYGMHDLGMLPTRPHKKCARIVGEILGKYHPHGDVAVYDTLVRMAQDFSHRYELIDGHGNFGSIDGDSPAAMRYTEARLSPLSLELLRDLGKNTVDFVPNFDETLEEPAVLPGRFPNLLVNGSSGIAVGMATNIPPHNLGEIIEATIAYIDHPDITVSQLMKFVKGPDFPTGALIMGRQGIREAYETGRGHIKVRGKAHVEQPKGRRARLVVTELPYQVNKARLIEKIADLVREDKITGISDLRDESDRQGMRLVVELKREAVPQVVLNQLYKHTQLGETFGVIMLALVDGVPRTLSLTQMLQYYLEHQKEVVTRRTRFELERAKKRAHILAGLLIALENLDQVIETIRASERVEEARTRLMEQFKLSEAQAQAILDMKLQRLTGLEREKIATEHQELLVKIRHLKELLASEKKILEVVKKELLEIKEKHGDNRRTEITADVGELDVEDLIAEEEMVVTVTRAGYVKRLPVASYRRQRRGGKGVMGLNLKGGDFVEHLFISSTHHYVLFFTNKGKVYRLKVHELPLAGRQARGQNIINLLPFAQDEKIAAVLVLRDFEQARYLVLATKKGLAKKTELSKYDSSRREGIIAITLRDGDELIGVRLTHGSQEIILVSRKGKAIRFHEEEVRAMGRNAMGVKGIALAKEDEVLGMDVVTEDTQLFVITDSGQGKRTSLDNYSSQRRGGQGVKTIKLKTRAGRLAGVRMVRKDQELMVISEEGSVIRVPVKGVASQGRNTQGVRIMNLNKGDSVSALARVVVSKKKELKEKES